MDYEVRIAETAEADLEVRHAARQPLRPEELKEL
jgi:hypothetical protein